VTAKGVDRPTDCSRVKGRDPSTSSSNLVSEQSMTCTGGGDFGDKHYSRQSCELYALLLAIVSPASLWHLVSMAPAVTASMLLGASVALMLCGSITFTIGLLMPWVTSITLLFGFVGTVNTLSSPPTPLRLFLYNNTKQPPPWAFASTDPYRDRICGWVGRQSGEGH
jgi:hypothetical protein